MEPAVLLGADRRRCVDGRSRRPARTAVELCPPGTIAKTARYVVLAAATLGVLA